MNKNLSVKKTIVIHSNPEKVWDAITNPEKIKFYFFGTETICDWKVGNPIIFQGEYQGHKYKDKGTILAIEPGKFLQYDYWSGFSKLEDKPENYSLVSYTLEYTDNEVILSVSQVGFANEQFQQHANVGWENVLNTIKNSCEE